MSRAVPLSGLILILCGSLVAACTAGEAVSGDDVGAPAPDGRAVDQRVADSSGDLPDRGPTDLRAEAAAADVGGSDGLCGGKACDDGLSCTDDVCEASGCVHRVKSGTCLIGGVCYAEGAKNAAAACQACRPLASNVAWTDDATLCKDDGVACTTTVCLSGVCSHKLDAGTCLLSGGSCVKHGASPAGSACEVCDTAVSTSALQKKTDGTACTADAYACTTDACKDGKCTHAVVSGSCLVGGVCYLSGELNPTQDCRGCVPATSTTAWSVLSDGATCTDDGLSCTADTCSSGKCTHTLSAGSCKIGGVCFVAGAAKPGADCMACDPTQAADKWSPVKDGTACTADALACTTDACSSGQCTHTLMTDRCIIGGACWTKGQPNPGNACRGCVPASNAWNWSDLPDGTTCTADAFSCTSDTCKLGKCTHTLMSGYCLIGTKCYAQNTKNMQNPCLACLPGLSTSAFSTLPDGTACTSDGISCTDDRCSGGACTHTLSPGFCHIGTTCAQNGQDDPANACQQCNTAASTSAWTPKPDGTACADDGVTCTQDACKAGVCEHPLMAGFCRIGGLCVSGGASDPQNACQFCEPNTSTSAWTPRAVGHPCPGGSCAGATCCGGCVAGGACYPGTADTLCGQAGAACAPCPGGSRCQSGTCRSLGCTSLAPSATCQGCDCQACVCAMDPYCCSTAWDNQCAGECRSPCGGNCP